MVNEDQLREKKFEEKKKTKSLRMMKKLLEN